MSSERTCGKCGAVMGGGLPGDLCPRCLLSEGMGEPSTTASDTHRIANPLFVQKFGDYELLSEVARGGMGIVYKAHQRSLNRTVAIKVLLAGEFASPETRERFQTEATAAARLQHPNIVSVHEVGEMEGVRYLTMEFVEGQNLAQLQGGSPLPSRRAASLAKTLAEAIEYAHQRGVLHRDLKPSNVLIDPFGEPRITDFGLAKVLSLGSELTLTGQVLGTPGYLPPEQVDSSCGPVTPASDIYSLGAILYYMLTARAPFAAGSAQETLRLTLTEDPVPTRMLNPDTPKDLETICLKCLDRDANKRYATAAALARDLQHFLAGEPIIARPISTTARLARWCKRRPTLAALWSSLALLAAGSTVSAVWIQAARHETESALAEARAADARSLERLREARLAQARAVRRTPEVGRRAQAMAALAEAAKIRPGLDLRNEAAAALMLYDLREVERFDLGLQAPGEITFDPSGTVAAVAYRDSHGGILPQPLEFRRQGQKTPFAALGVGQTNPIGAPVFSADGTMIMARFHDHTLRVFKVGTPAPFLTLGNLPPPGELVGTEDQNTDYDFSPDGRHLVIGLPGGGISVHRVDGGAEVARWSTNTLFNRAAFSPDGKLIAAVRTAAYNVRSALVLRSADLSVAKALVLPSSPDWACWSDDSQFLAVPLSDGSTWVYDVRNDLLTCTLRSTTVSGHDQAFAAQGRLLASRGKGTTMRLVNVGTGREELVLEGSNPNAPAVRRNSLSFISCGIDQVAVRYEIQLPTGYRTLPTPVAAGLDLTITDSDLDFTDDGRWMVTSHGRFTVIRDTELGRMTDMLEGKLVGQDLASIAVVDGGRAVARCGVISGLSLVALTNGPDGKPLFGAAKVLDGATNFLIHASAQKGHRLLLLGKDPRQGDEVEVKVLELNESGVSTLSAWTTRGAYSGVFSPDAQFVLVNAAAVGTNGADYRIRVHRVIDGGVVKELPAPVSCDAAWSDDGKTAMTSNGRSKSIVWNTETWTPRFTLEGALGGDSTTFAVSPDSAYLAVTRDEQIHLLSAVDGHELASFGCTDASGYAAGLRFSRDGKQVAVLWRDGRVDIITPEEIRRELQSSGLGW